MLIKIEDHNQLKEWIMMDLMMRKIKIILTLQNRKNEEKSNQNLKLKRTKQIKLLNQLIGRK